MSQFQTQRAPAFISQQQFKFNQLIKDKELSGNLICLENLIKLFDEYSLTQTQFENVFHAIDDNDDESDASHEQQQHHRENDLQSNLEYLGVFCYKYLNLLALDQLLSKQIFKSLTCFLEVNLSSLGPTDLDYESSTCDFLSCIESILDYIALNLSPTTSKFEFYSNFTLTILNFVWNYLKPYERRSGVSGDGNAETTTQINALTLINAILIKLSNLIESKLSDLAEAKHELSLLRLCKVYAYFIEYFKENSKSVVFLWKVLQKLVNKIGLLQLKQRNKLTEKLKLNIVIKMFLVLHARLYEQINILKTTVLNCTSVTHSDDTHTMTSGNFQEITKIIKLSLFLFKIFKTLLTNHFNELRLNLNDTFFALAINLCSLINSIFLFEHQSSIETCLSGTCNDDSNAGQSQVQSQSKKLNLKQRQAIKAEFIKGLNDN
jgi:hypothetical protein